MEKQEEEKKTTKTFDPDFLEECIEHATEDEVQKQNENRHKYQVK